MELNIERIVMGGAVIVKIVTMQLMKAMQRSIEVVNQSRIKAVRELSKAQSRKNITASEQHKHVSRRKKSVRKSARSDSTFSHSRRSSLNGRNSARQRATKSRVARI